MLEIEGGRQGTVMLVEVSGRLDRASAERLGDFLRAEVDAGERRLLLDMQGLDYLGLDGLWELMTALKHARRARGDLRLARPSDRAREALVAAGLDEIFRIYETQAEALAGF